MKATSVFLLAPDNTVAFPIQPSDLAPLAQETTLQALKVLVQGLPKASTKAAEITIDLSIARVDYPVPVGTMTSIQTVIIKDLAGTTATLKMGTALESPLSILKGEVRDRFEVGALFLSCPGGAGGTITLELQGR